MKPKPDTRLDTSLGYLVRRTFQAFSRSLEARLARHDITISMWFFLRLLWESDGMTQREIGDQLGLAPSTTVSAMDNLEARKFIVRKRSLEDRRKVNIHLTDEGRSLAKQLRPYAAAVNQIAAAGLTREERDTLWRLLNQVRAALEAELGDDKS